MQRLFDHHKPVPITSESMFEEIRANAFDITENGLIVFLKSPKELVSLDPKKLPPEPHSPSSSLVLTVKNSQSKPNQVYAGLEGGQISVFENKKFLTQLIGHKGEVRALVEHVDSGILVSSSNSRDENIIIWNNNQKAMTLSGHNSGVGALAMYENQIISGAFDGMIKYWDLKSGNCLKTFKGHDSIIYGMDVYNDLLATVSADKSVKVWDVKTQKCVKKLDGHEKSVLTVKFLPNGDLVTGSDDHSMRIWNLRSDGEAKCKIVPHLFPVCNLAVTKEGNIISGTKRGSIYLHSNPLSESEQPVTHKIKK